MKRPGHYGASEGGTPKRQFGARNPSSNRGRDEGFGARSAPGGRDGAPWQARHERGGFDRGSDRGNFGGRDRDRGGYDAGADRSKHRSGHRDDQPRSFDAADRRPASRSFGNNNGQNYRREGGMRGGYGRPARPDEVGFQSFTPPTADPVVPTGRVAAGPQPVPAQKLKEGVAHANKALAGLIEQFGNTIRGDYDISEMEATVSFDRDGRFLGFGAGGAVSFSLTITPLEAEDVFAQDTLAEPADADLLDTTGAIAGAVADTRMMPYDPRGDEDTVAAVRHDAMAPHEDRVLDDDSELRATLDVTTATPFVPEPSLAQPNKAKSAKRGRAKNVKAAEVTTDAKS